MNWENVMNSILEWLKPIAAPLFQTLLSVDLALIVVATIGATQILKLFVKYAFRSPKKQLLWVMALTVVTSLLFSWMTWDGVNKLDWVVVGFAAAPLSNVVFWLGMRMLRRCAPSVAAWAQNPIMKP